MARVHGKDSRAYLGGYDRSGDIISITPKFTADTHDGSVVGTGWRANHPGLIGWEVDIEAFYNSAAGEIGRQFEDLLGASGVLSIFEGDANAAGDNGIVFSGGILSSYGQPIAAADMVKLNGSIKGNGRAGFYAKLLHENSEETGTGSTSGADIIDNGASSANGGRGNLHVLAITGTWTIVIEHSDDAAGVDPWAAVCSFTQVAAAGGVTAETVAITGTVKQFLRVTYTEDVAGSCTFMCAFARY